MDEQTEMMVKLNLAVFAVALTALIIDLVSRDENIHRPTRRRKRVWIKHILRKRDKEGTFNLLIPKLLADDVQYRNFFRMNKESFLTLLSFIESDLRKQDTRCRRSISVNEQLALTLRYLATGSLQCMWICIYFSVMLTRVGLRLTMART
jgi:hypothetical protein